MESTTSYFTTSGASFDGDQRTAHMELADCSGDREAFLRIDYDDDSVEALIQLDSRQLRELAIAATTAADALDERTMRTQAS